MVRLRDQAATCIPNAFARTAISRPIWPSPTMPRVRPCSPRAFEYSALFQTPARLSATWSGTRRSQESRSAITSSATATELRPGQLETNTPRADAAGTSIVSMPAPARITRPRLGPAFSAAAVTLVLRTISTLGSVSASAAGRSSAVSSGRISTVQPSSLSPSIPTFSNLSAIRTFMLWRVLHHRVAGPACARTGHCAAWARTRCSWGASPRRRRTRP